MIESNKRLWVLTVVGFLILGVIAFRLADLQIYRSDYYQAVAASQRQRASELAPNRGTIYVQESRTEELFPVAVNDKTWIAYAVPRDIDNPKEVADELAPAVFNYRERQKIRITNIIGETGQQLSLDRLERDEETIENSDEENSNQESDPDPLTPEELLDEIKEELTTKFSQKTDPYEPFLRFYEVLDEEFKQFIEERNLPGIVLEEQNTRTYPEKTLAAHLLGYLGWEDSVKVGRYGVEGFFEDDLKGDLGFLSVESDSRGRFIDAASREFKPAEDGSDIVLTIDRVVQSIIEDELANGVNKFSAERGSVIVMEPSTGAILGMATYPSYDPNYYYAINEAGVQLNPVVSELFEPGSILKPLIMAAAIDEERVEPDTTMVDAGPVRVAEYTIDNFDSKHHRVQTMTQVLEKSNNVGMVWVGQQLGAEAMYDYLRRFGIGEKTGIELEGETQATLKPPSEWNITTVATSAFGQGIALTPLQALNGINAIANDGQLMQPYVVSRIRFPDGDEKVTHPTAVRQVIQSRTAKELQAMMVSVIENGVAGLAKVPGFYLAGKTGTAQVPDERGKYSEDKKIITFVGYGPIDNPKFTILVKLDNPAGLSFASGTAAPMFQNIAEKLLQYYQIAPDYDPAKRPKPFQVPTRDSGAEA